MSPVSESAFNQLAVVTRALGSSARFSSVLADATLPVTAKLTLLGDVTRGALQTTGETADLLRKALQRYDVSVALPEHLLRATAVAGFDVAAQSNRIERVESDLLSIASLAEGDSSLLFALTNPGATDAVKQELVTDLLQGKVDPIALQLINTLIGLDHGHAVVDRVKWLASLAAAHQGHVLADVRSAVPLDDAYRQKVTATLTRAVGRAVKPRFVVDPSIVGSLVVRVEDEVWDGSVRRRLQQAREALTGSAS